MFSRLKLEEIEDRSLAPYGMRSKDSKGRAFVDTEPDYRTTSSVTETGCCTQLPSGDLNTKRRCLSILKVTISARG
jgi:hypothetical protein